MASISSSSFADTASGGTVGSFNANGSETHQPLAGSDPTGTANDTKSSESTVMTTPVLVGIIVASVIAIVVALLVIRSRRRRYDPKLFSPSNSSTFQGVTSTTASDHTSNVFGASSASTDVTSPQHPPLLQTFKLSRLSGKEASGDHFALDVHETPVNGLSSVSGTRDSRTTGLISSRSASMLWNSSLPSFAPFGASRASRTSGTNGSNELHTPAVAPTVPISPPNSSALGPVPLEQRTEGDAWRDLSDTCWSIGPGSDSETESERFTMSMNSQVHAQGGALVLNRNRLSTLSDGFAGIDEEDGAKDLDANSLDDSSRRRERGISQFDDSSLRRVRGLSALDGGRSKANSRAGIDTNTSGDSYFSVDSEYYGETIKDCSAVLFDDSDSDSDSLSSSSGDSDDSLREEEF
ncbi:hypothetical protein PHYPSEUDO_002317 [Phytophthora pseudosyringae]|uniref:Uncharacterized protein n=1 Tax=Phytophthora pseudosyringae TaxID=221518 RepID=A0A8T1WJJ3_9STRA|nr:hypothetical protein PHYPSEUDO_002317 [Phytophthora pseudosyringae]